MGEILMPGGAGGVASDDVSIRKSDVPVGLTTITSDSDDEIVEGTLSCTVQPSDVKKNATFYNTSKRAKDTGTMNVYSGGVHANSSIVDSSNLYFQSPAGYLPSANSNGYFDVYRSLPEVASSLGLSAANLAKNHVKCGLTGTYTGIGSAGAGQVLSGYTASNSSTSNFSGTLPNYLSSVTHIDSVRMNNGRFEVAVPYGAHGCNWSASYEYMTLAQVRSAIGLTADKVKKGVPILDITGSFEGYTTSPLYLFNNGTWSNLQTTGMTNCTVSGSNLLAASAGWHRLNQTVDLTNYNYLKISAKAKNADYNGSRINIGISQSSASHDYDSASVVAKAQLNTDSADYGTAILNVSAFNGFYYICVYGIYQWMSFSAVSIQDGFINQILLSKN